MRTYKIISQQISNMYIVFLYTFKIFKLSIFLTKENVMVSCKSKEVFLTHDESWHHNFEQKKQNSRNLYVSISIKFRNRQNLLHCLEMNS